MWGLGDYHRFATTMIWGFGPELVAACDIGPGKRVLDVATGTGNVALRAAEAGADVVASDLEPAQLAAGRRAADARGLELAWVEADAAALPFPDASFDVVTSSAGAIFAPEQQAVADELVRVCRPGGTIGMINFTPGSMAEAFFAVFGRHAPPSNGAPSPIRWGDEAHVRALFGPRVDLALSRRSYVERSPGGPREFCDFYKATFGPVVALYAALDDDASRRARRRLPRLRDDVGADRRRRARRVRRRVPARRRQRQIPCAGLNRSAGSTAALIVRSRARLLP